MTATAVATRGDIDDILNVLDVMMTRIDDRFTRVEDRVDQVEGGLERVEQRLDSIEKRLEISGDERLVMAHQLGQLHGWAERAAKRIGVKFTH